MQVRYPHVILFALLIIGIFCFQYSSLSVPLLDTHHIRQSDTASIVRNMQRYGVDIFRPMIDWAGPIPQPVEMELPLYNVLMSWVLNGQPIDSSSGVFQVRFASFGLWVLMLGVYLRFSQRLFPTIGFVAAMTVAISPLSFVFSRSVQPDFLALFFAMVALDKALALSDGESRFRWCSLLVGWSAAALAIAVKGTMVFALVGLVPLVIAYSKRQSEYVGWILAGGVGLSWYWYAHSVLGQSGVTFGIWESNAKKWGSIDLWLQWSSWRKLAEVLVYCVWTPIGTVFVLMGVFSLRRLKNVQFQFVACTLSGCLVGICTAMDGFLRHEYYFVILLPITGLVVAHGVLHLKRVVSSYARWLQISVVVLLGLLSVYSIQTSVAYIDASRRVDEQVANHVSLLNGVMSAGETVLVVDAFAQSILFHADLRGWVRTALNAEELDFFIAEGLDRVVVFDIEVHSAVIEQLNNHRNLSQPQNASRELLVWTVQK